MWAIRLLSGNQVGQIFPLKEGKNMVGRGNNCQIRFDDMNISKEHALIVYENNQLTLMDNQSRNGTFLNGVLINRSSLKSGDKVSFNQTLCDVIQLPNHPQNRSLNPIANHPNHISHPYQAMPPDVMNNPIALTQYQLSPQSMQSQMPHPEYAVHGIPIESQQPAKEGNFFIRYFEEVLMPGIYQLGTVMEFKIVIGFFMMVFAVLVTALSTIPMIAITSDSIQLESRRRALTIARNMANINQQALLKDMESALSTQNADLEEGVSQAYIIRQNDGSVIAPASKAGTIPSIPFIETARREQKELVKQIDSSHVAVAVPLSAFNPDTSTYTIKAFAIVIYDMGALAVDDGRTLSLFFQTLLIALILGFTLYYLFYRFVEYPVSETNKQLDELLKNKTDSVISIDLDFPLFQKLISNINTLLTRVSNSDSSSTELNSGTKEYEIINLVRFIGYAGMAITADHIILGFNHAAEHLLGLSESQIRNQPITLIPDQALQKSLYDLMDLASQNPATPSRNELEFSGVNTELNCQAITERGKVKYFIVTIIPLEGHQ